MSTRPTAHASMAVVEGVSATLVGGGIVTMALFPLALPALALTALAALPFLVLPLAAGLLVAVAALPILLVRSLTRRASRALRPSGPAKPRRPSFCHRTWAPQPRAMSGPVTTRP
jgi:hypothetical protein